MSRRDFLYSMTAAEARWVIRGYRRREEKQWELARWQVFWTLHNGWAPLDKWGIRTEQDIIRFPWENDKGAEISDEEQQEMLQILHSEQAKWGK